MKTNVKTTIAALRNDLPKIDALKQVYPDVFRETPVLVSGPR